MNQPDWNNDPILKKFMVMCKHQLEWSEQHTINKNKQKQAKAREEKKRYFEKVRREKALLELL
jgi:hypothetical protein